MIEAVRLFAFMFGVLYCFVWALWTCWGPANHSAIALISLSYLALCVECWAFMENHAVDSSD